MGLLGGLLAVVGLGAACSTVDSKDLRTSGITADIVVTTGERGGVTFTANLAAGTLTDVDLTGDDGVVGETPDYRVTLEKTKFLGQTVYRGTINDTDAAPGEQMTVRLARGGDDDAPGSTVAMPAAVEIASPAAGARVPRSEPLRLGLNDAPGSIRVTWTGECLAEDSAGLSFAEGEPVVLPAGSLRAADVDGPDRPCQVTLSVSRLLDGTLDPAYKGGSIRSERTVRVEVVSTP